MTKNHPCLDLAQGAVVRRGYPWGSTLVLRTGKPLQADRLIGHAPRSRAFGEKLQSSPSTCIGCKDCTGVCMALIDVLMVPETILGHD